MSDKTRPPATESELIPKASLTDEEKLQLAAKVSADAIYDWDIAENFTRWNHGLNTLFGYEGDSDSVQALFRVTVPLKKGFDFNAVSYL